MNEAFPAPQIGHIYYYMKIPAELAGHGGFVGDYAEKHVRIFAYLIVFFTFAILIMLFSKRAKSMKTGHKTHIPGIGNRKKSTSMNRFAIFITALLIASGCSTEKHDDEQFFYPYEGINRFSVEYSGDTILLTARYTAEEETIKLYPKNGEYYRRSEDFGEELVMTVKDVPRYELYNHLNPSEGNDDRGKTVIDREEKDKYVATISHETRFSRFPVISVYYNGKYKINKVRCKVNTYFAPENEVSNRKDSVKEAARMPGYSKNSLFNYNSEEK